MTREVAYAIAATALLTIAAFFVPASQGTPVQHAVKVARDSINCSGVTASARQRRACARLDSVIVTPIAPAPANQCLSAPGARCFAARQYYNAAGLYATNAGVDTVTVCAVIEDVAGVKKLAWPPVRLKTLGDSASWVNRSGNPLSVMCARAIAAEGLSRTDSLLVLWSGHWFSYFGRRIFRPFPAVP